MWDYTTKAQIATLEGHTSNVSFAIYHPELPVIISGSEDGTVKIWHANTYRLEQSLNYGLERAWCVSYQRGKQGVAVGFDDGAVVVKMGREEPAVSMDASGKIIWAKHSEILTSVIKGGDKTLKDGDRLTLPSKDLGSTELYPQSLVHSPNGRFVAVCGDGEYIIYTALALRNQAFGSALDFAWASKENDKDYAIRESGTSVKIFRNFKEKSTGGLNVGFQADGLSGGTLLGVKGQGGIGFFDWESGQLIRRIEVEPKNVSLTVIASHGSIQLNTYRSTGQRTASSSHWRAKIPSTSSASPGRTMLLPFRQARLTRTGLRRLSRSLRILTRGKSAHSLFISE